jgi:DNA-binding ferritin-like protein
VKLGESTTVAYEELQRAYGEHSLSGAQAFRWHKSFSEGREQVGDLQSQTDDNVERVRSLGRSDRRLTLRKISSELRLNRSTVHQMLTRDLGMRRVCAKMVPKNLTTEQKANRRVATALRGSQNSPVALP